MRFSKARAIHGDAAQPLDVQLVDTPEGGIDWTWRTASLSQREKAISSSVKAEARRTSPRKSVPLEPPSTGGKRPRRTPPMVTSSPVILTPLRREKLRISPSHALGGATVRLAVSLGETELRRSAVNPFWEVCSVSRGEKDVRFGRLIGRFRVALIRHEILTVSQSQPPRDETVRRAVSWGETTMRWKVANPYWDWVCPVLWGETDVRIGRLTTPPKNGVLRLGRTLLEERLI